VGEDLESASDLDTSITTKIEHHDLDELEDICLQESCEGVVEPTKLKCNDDILSMEYASFSCGMISMKALMWVFVLNMNHFPLMPS